jgi:ammonium transporter, Amt family
MIHTVFMTAIIYPICVYWGWSGTGWLNYTEDGVTYKSTISSAWYQDWAGSGIIHLVGGVAALTGAVIVGPRKGRFDGTASEDEFAPHSVPFTVLGTFILWFGWYGFNPGSTGQMHMASTAYTSALVAVNTTLAPCIAGLVVFIGRATVFPPRRFDVGALCNGILAGCVAITAPCAWVKPWEAIIIGIIGGLLYLGSAMFWPAIKVDDPIDALSVHLVNGLWGALAIGFFGDPKEGIGGNGVFYGGNQLGVQVVACICFMVWSCVLSIVVFLPMRFMGILRWSDTFQDAGADEMQHSPKKSVEHSPSKAYLKP